LGPRPCEKPKAPDCDRISYSFKTTISGLMHRSKTSIFDHLVGTGEQGRQDIDTELSRRLSNLVGRTTGGSEGFSPASMRPT
jgi:hypothetical protein